jgi:hypothetical protein
MSKFHRKAVGIKQSREQSLQSLIIDPAKLGLDVVVLDYLNSGS